MDDVVSVGRPAPSVHSDHTHYDLLQRHLKDRHQLEQDFPDGSEDGYRPKEEEERPDGTGSTECLLDISSTPSTRGKATVLNYQAKQKTNGGTIEGVEMEAVAAASGDHTEEDSMGRGQEGGLEETKSLLRSPRTITVLGGELEACKPKPPKPVEQESQRVNGRKAHKSKKSKKKDVHMSDTPSILVNSATSPAVPPVGYVKLPGGSAVSSRTDPAQSNHLASIFTVASSELAGKMQLNPSSSTPYQEHCSQQSALEELELSHDPLQLRGLSTNSESVLPFSVHSNLPWQQNQFTKPTPGYIQDASITSMWKTQDNIGTGPPLATIPLSKPPRISVEAIIEPLPAIQAELPNSTASLPTTSQQHPTFSTTAVQQQHDGSYQFIQGSTTDLPPSVPRSNPEFNLGELAEDYDDSASDTSSHNSVFEDLDTQRAHEGYTPWPQGPHNQQRTRSQVTSGVSSQSESTEPDGGRWRRMLSEGYHSGPNTPVGKEHTDFSLCEPSQDSSSGISETLLSDMPGSDAHSKDHSSSGISETLLSDMPGSDAHSQDHSSSGISDTLLSDTPGMETHSNSSGYVTSPGTENRNEFSFGLATHPQVQLPYKDPVGSSCYVSIPPAVSPVAQQTLQKPSDNQHLPHGKAANQICSIKMEESFSLPTPTFESPKPTSVKSPLSSPSIVTLLSGSRIPSYVASPTELKARVPLKSKLCQTKSHTGKIDPTKSAPSENVSILFSSASTTYTLPSLLASNTKDSQTTRVPLATVASKFSDKPFDSERTNHVKPFTDTGPQVADKSYMPHGESETTLNCQNYMNTANIDMDKIGFDLTQFS